MMKLLMGVAVAMPATLFAVSAYAGENIGIGFTAALSGDYAAFGTNLRRGLDLALKEIGDGGKFTYSITALDDRAEAREGALIAQRFCSDETIKIVMGYSVSSIALAAVPIYDSCKLPVLASAVTNPSLSGVSKYFRRNILTDAVQGEMMGSFSATKIDAKTIYILHQQDDYGIGIAKAFGDAAAKDGAEIIGQEAYLLGDKDFRTLLTKARSLKPDAIFIGGFYTEAALIAQQAKSLGLEVKLLGTDGALNAELIKLGGDAVEGMILYGMFDPSVATEATKPFIDAYQAAYGNAPNAFAALGYDAGMTLAAAVGIAGEKGEVNRESLNAAFSELKDVPGVTGPTTFSESGDRSGKLYFITVKDGQFALSEKQ